MRKPFLIALADLILSNNQSDTNEKEMRLRKNLFEAALTM